MNSLSHNAAAFGAWWRSDIELAQFDPWDDCNGGTPIEVLQSSALPARTPLRSINRGHVYEDGFRFAWHDEVTFDMFALANGTSRIEYCPGHAWSGQLPVAFYSTVAALTLAWQGRLALHGSVVALEDRAVLIMGPAGAGKSSLAAGLLASGGALISDDLTVLGPDPLFATLGRPTIRLHPDTAAHISGTAFPESSEDLRGKLLWRPSARFAGAPLPLAAVILLGEPKGPIAASRAAALLAQHLFRPAWQARLPGHAERLRKLIALAGRVPVAGFARASDYSAGVWRDRAEQIAEFVGSV